MSTMGWGGAISASLGAIALGVWWQLLPAQGASMNSTALVTASRDLPPACTPEAGSLTHDRVSGAVRDFLPGVLPCVAPAATPPADTLHLRLQVACTGSVSHVELIEGGDWPSAVVDCVQDRLASVLFPQHAALEGVVVDLPLRFPPLDASRGPR